MKKRIQIIRGRDDVSNLGIFSTELKNRGFLVREYVANPNLAYFNLSTELDDTLVILEKMIQFDENELPRGLLTRENTDEYKHTGFKLLEELIHDNPSIFPNSAVIYDNLFSNSLDSISTKEKSEELGVPIISQDNAIDFGNAVEYLYQKLICKY